MSVVPITVLLLLIVPLISLFLSIRLLDHPFFPHKEYYKIYNWDLPLHVSGKDIDKDGKNDLITFSGCAFLSSVEPESIPEEQRCEATGMSVLEDEIHQVGRKYGAVGGYDRGLKEGGHLEWPFLAYLVKTPDDQWLLIQKPTFIKGTKAYLIDSQGHIQQTSLPWLHRIYVMSYTASVILITPIFLVMYYIAR